MTEDLIECACGCGGVFEPLDKEGKPRRFLPGHWAKTQQRQPGREEKRAAYSKKYHQENRERLLEKKREWRERNPDKVAEYKRRNREQKRASKSQRRKLYGISPEQYEAMLAAQGNLCAICGTYREVLDVDHDHQTGKLRALLCRQCNTGLGLLKDDIGLIGQAITYLRAHQDTE